MQKIIDFFEKSEHDWSLGNDLYENYIHVAECFGYKFKTHKTKHEVEEFLKGKLIECLSGDDVSCTQFRKVEDHISLKYYSSNKGDLKEAFFFISYIRYLINVLDSYTNSIESWSSAKKYLEALYSLGSGYDPKNTRMFQEQEFISRSIGYLRSKKYNVLISDGNAHLDSDSEILSAIDYRLDKLGEQSLFFIMMMLSKKYDSKSRRYLLRSEPVLIDQSKLDIPWGYLFNVSLNKIYEVNNPKKNFRKNTKIFEEVVDLAKHYFCLQRIQTLNKFSDINLRYDTILPAIQRNILYDQHFSIDQISNDHVSKMVGGMFKSALLESFDVNVDIYIDIMKWIFSQPHEKPFMFTTNDFYYYRCKYEINEIENVLDKLSHNVNHINKGYLNPSDIVKRNYYKKPFVKRGQDYIFVNSNFCSYGFYFSLFDLYRNQGVNGDILGKVAEEFVENILTESGITYHSNKKYKIPKNIARELEIQSQGRECDYIVETDDTVVFIELKRKTLTSDARAGDALTSMVDISQSLFHALSQAGCHEYNLRKQGRLKFTDGTEVELKNRKVEKVALTLFGFFGIQDGMFVNEMMNSLLRAEINGDDESKNKEINERLEELRNQYRTELFSKIYFEDRSYYFNCRFFSVPQLMEILSHSSCNEDFLTELNRTRHVTTGCKDWFKEYYYMHWLKKQ